MKTLFEIARRHVHFFRCLAIGFVLAGLPQLHAATVSLLAGDNLNESSFNTAGHWSDSSAPSSANDYTVTNKNIRTPTAGGNYTFAGNSLTLTGASFGTPGLLVFKGTAASDVITVNNLHLNNYGGVTNGMGLGSVASFTLAGSIILNAGQTGLFQLTTGNGGYTVASTISGSGELNIYSNASSLSSVAVTLTGNNTYTGGTTLLAYSYVKASSEHALGMGNVKVNGGLLLIENTLAMDDSASLILASGLTTSSVALYFSDTMTIRALSFDGGSTYIDSGTYTISELNTRYGQNVFIGDGVTDSAMIQVIPEPSTYALGGVGVFILCVVALMRSRREKSAMAASV